MRRDLRPSPQDRRACPNFGLARCNANHLFVRHAPKLRLALTAGARPSRRATRIWNVVAVDGFGRGGDARGLDLPSRHLSGCARVTLARGRMTAAPIEAKSPTHHLQQESI